MEFNCKVNIVDAIMGAGKTQSIMNYINQSDEDEKFLVITSFLDEIDRYRKYCSCKNFKAPTFLKDDKDEKGSKLTMECYVDKENPRTEIYVRYE